MDLIGVKEVMKMTGMGRDKAMRLLRDESCPTFPREFHQPYLVDRNEFISWWTKKCLKKKVRL